MKKMIQIKNNIFYCNFQGLGKERKDPTLFLKSPKFIFQEKNEMHDLVKDIAYLHTHEYSIYLSTSHQNHKWPKFLF